MSLEHMYTCTVCGKNNFKSENGYRVHVVRVHPENISILEKKKYPCDLCEQSFEDRPGLSHHRAKHKNTEKIKASILEAKASVLAQNELPLETKELKEEISSLKEFITSRLPEKQEKVCKKPSTAQGYVYLLIEREFIDKNEDVYKIGMTSQPNQKRFLSYPKGSTLLYQIGCENCVKSEKIILQKFKEKFVQMKEIGTEYFKGDYHEMFRVICSVIMSENDFNSIEEKGELEDDTVIEKAKKYDAIFGIVCGGI